jgi:hypothetical protein
MLQQSQPSYPENQEFAGKNIDDKIFTSHFVIEIVREIFERVIW